MLRRSMVKLLLGLLLLGNGANILIFLMGGLTKGKPPILGENEKHFTDAYADPVPQALILTAIVISFSLVAYTMVLFERAHQALHTMDPDAMHHAEPDAGTSWSGRA